MSRTIDERVVSMQFDNRHFESNVRTSLSTLDKLKQSLNFTGAAKGLDNINATAKNMNFSGLSGAVDSVKVKFSALEVMAVTALSNITNSAVNAGKKIASAFTIEPIRTGFAEYETQIGAVQTILANTQHAGTDLDDVNAALDELNKYADQTIYNFTEMTRNIGTFTAAGVDLDKSVQSIKGIANLAAVSGSTSQQASTAMYQLSQALAAGKVSLMDWNSVVNAGMGGKVFQDALVRTSELLKTGAKDAIATYGSFRESLTKGEWLTTEVLTETLAQLSGAYSEADLIAQGFTEKQAKEITELAETAVNAATKVKTFTQLMDTLKEAAQSGWTQTWELLIGDFEEAKEVWSSASDVLGNLINASSESRNKLLEGALVSNWDRLTGKIEEAGIKTEKFEEKVKSVAKSHGVDMDALIKEYGSLEKVFQSGAASSDILKEALGSVGKSMADLSKIKRNLKFDSVGEDVKQLQTALKDLGYDLGHKGVDGIIGKYTEGAIKAFQEAQGLKVTGIVDKETLAALEKATAGVDGLAESCEGLIGNIDKLGGRDLLINSIKNIFKGLTSVAKPIRAAFEDIFTIFKPENLDKRSKKLYEIIEGFEKFTSKLILSDESGEKLKRTFKGLFAIIDIVTTVVGGGMKAAFKVLSRLLGNVDIDILEFTASLGDAIVAFRDWLFEGNAIAKGFDKVITIIGKVIAKVRDFVKAFLELPEVQNIMSNIKSNFIGIGDTIKSRFAGGLKVFKEFIDRVKSMDSISLSDIGDIFKDFFKNVVGYFIKTDTGTIFDGFINAVKNLRDKVVEYLENAGIKIREIGRKIKDFFIAIKENISNNLGGLIALGGLVALFLVIKKIKDAIELIAHPFEFLDDLGEGLKSLGNALKFSVRATAVKNIATAIAILAGSVTVMAMLPPGKLWSAVGAMFAISAILTAMAVIFNNKKLMGDGSLGEMAKLSGTVLALSGSLLVFGIAAKVIAGIDSDGLIKSGVALGAFVGAIVLISKATKNINTVNFASFGTMMLGLAAALLVFSVSIGILGTMDIKTLAQGGLAVTAFLVMMVGMMAATKLLAKDLPKFATTMVGLGAALLVFSISVGILGNMDMRTLIQGGMAVAAFLAMMAGMMAATKLLAKDMPKFGATMTGISIGLLSMAVAIKILGSMDTSTLVKGSLVIAGFMGMMVLLMAATKLLTKNSKNAGQIGLMMLSFSASLLLLSGAIAILGNMDGGKLAKAVGVITVVGLLFGGLVALTKFAKAGKGVKATILSMSAAIGILAITLAALSFVDKDKLMSATAAISVVMAMFAALIASTKLMKAGVGNIVTLVIMAGVVAVLGGVIAELCKLDVDSAMPVATALSKLILSLSASCVLLGVVGKLGAGAFIGVGVLAALMAVLAIFATIAIASLPAIGNQLSKFMENLQPFLDGAARITPDMANGIKSLAEAILFLTGANMLNAITSFFSFGTKSLADFGKELAEFGEGLGEFLWCISDATSSVAGADGKQASINWDNVEKATDAAVKLAEVANKIPNTSGIATWFAKKDLGAFGEQVAQFAKGLSSYLTSVGGEFMKLNTESGKMETVTINWDNIAKAFDAAMDLVELAKTIPNTSGIATWFAKKDLGVFGEQIGAFTSGLSSYLAAVGTKFSKLNEESGRMENVDINWDNVAKATESAVGLANAANKIPDTGGLSIAFAQKDLGIFGTQVADFASGLISYLTAVGTKFSDLDAKSKNAESVDINWENVTNATDAAVQLANAAHKIPDTSGWLVETFAKKDLGVFGTQIASFAEGLCSYLTAVGGKFSKLSEQSGVTENVNINWENVTKATEMATELAALAGKIPDTSGWSTIFTNKDLGVFGSQVATFASGLATYLTTIGGPFTRLNASGQTQIVDINWENISKSVDASVKLVDLANKIPDTSGWSTIFSNKDLGVFGNQISTFAGGISSFIQSINTAFGEGAAITVDFTLIDTVISTADKLAEMAETVGSNSAGWDWITGKDGLDTFGEKVASFGDKLASFCEKVSGKSFDAGAISAAITEVEKFVKIAERVSETGSDDLADLGDNIKAIGKDIKSFSDKIADVDSSKFSDIADGLSKLAKIKIDNADTIQSFVNSLGKISADGVDKFASAFKDSAPKVIASVNAMITLTAQAIRNKGVALKNAFKDIASACPPAIKSAGLYSDLQAAGKYLVQGFASGISANTYLATAKAIAMANAAKQAAKDTLKINSPSKVFIPIGKSVPEGFAKGIDMMGKLVKSSVVGMAGNALDNTKKAMSRVSDILNSDMDTQPTIRPVLDLSDVTAGANSINSLFGVTPSVGVLSNIGAISSIMNGRQNGANDDVISAIRDLGRTLGNKIGGDTYQIGDITYDDGNNINTAVKNLVRAARLERRV